MDKQEFYKNYEMEKQHWWFCGRRAVLRGVLTSLDLNSDAQIFEAGCGTGGNIPMLGKFGHVDAMEYNDLALDFAMKKNPGVEILDGELPERIPFKERTYDLVCALDVLEHVEDDYKAVTALSGKLKEDGILFCTAPANPWMWSRHDEISHHQRRYSLNQFERLFSGNGLEILRATYFNSLLFPVAAAIRLSKFSGDASGSDLKKQSGLLNGILKGIFSMEKYLVPKFNMPFGLSVLCVARRKR